MSAPTADTEAALDFLSRMFDATVPRHLVAISETGKVAAQSFGPTVIERARAWIEARQGNANVYYSVNELKPSVLNRKAVKQDVAQALHLHVDVDDQTALSRISEFVPKPTTVVFSGGGYQAFWKLREPTRDMNRVERINAELARKLGGATTSTASCDCLARSMCQTPRSARLAAFRRWPTLSTTKPTGRGHMLSTTSRTQALSLPRTRCMLPPLSSQSRSINCRRISPRRRSNWSKSAMIPQPQ